MFSKKTKKPAADKTAMAKIIGFNELIKSSISDYKANWQKFFWLLILPLSVSFIVSVVFDVLEKNYNSIPAAILFPIVILAIAAFVFFAVVYVWALIAELTLLKDLTQEVKRANVWAWYKQSRPLFWKVVAISLVYGVLTFLLTLCLIVPGVIFMVAYFFAVYFIVMEGKDFEESLGCSRALVKDYWWAVFGRIFGGVMAMYLIYMLIVLIFMLLKVLLLSVLHLPGSEEIEKWAYDFLSLFGGLIFGPLSLIYMVKLFKSLQEVKK